MSRLGHTQSAGFEASFACASGSTAHAGDRHTAHGAGRSAPAGWSLEPVASGSHTRRTATVNPLPTIGTVGSGLGSLASDRSRSAVITDNHCGEPHIAPGDAARRLRAMQAISQAGKVAPETNSSQSALHPSTTQPTAAPARPLAITDEAPPLALRSTRIIRGEQCAGAQPHGRAAKEHPHGVRLGNGRLRRFVVARLRVSMRR